VSTASTKRRNRKKKRDDWGATRATPEGAPEAAPPAVEPPPDIPQRAWLVASIVILAAAAFLRLYALELKPMHHDEGVNGFFLTSLVRQGAYKYDPTNYHGPTLYYLSLPVAYAYGFFPALLSGQLSLAAIFSAPWNGQSSMAPIREAALDTTAVRLVTSLFGVATVWLVLCLRRHLGAVAALAGAALLAVSPGAVYYSRYFIHETLFVFFTLGIVVAALRFYETGSAWHLMLLSLSAALLFATKETHFVSVVTLLLAAAVPGIWERLRGSHRPTAAGGRRRGRAAETRHGEFLAKVGGDGGLASLLAGAVVLFVVVNVLFYSSFFTNWKGVADALKALEVWGGTGTSDFHRKPIYTYVNWLWQEESPILILAAVGSAVALFGRARLRFAVFVGAWAFGMLAAYSIIPYKTPWLALNFIVPLSIIAGYAVQSLARLPSARLGAFLGLCAAGGAAVYWLSDAAWLTAAAVRLDVSTTALQAVLVFALVALLTAFGAYLARDAEGRGEDWQRVGAHALAAAGLACAVCAYQAWVLNFQKYDDDTYPYVYSHSQRGLIELVREVERLAERTGRGRETAVSIASPEYWPLPWYFRDYKAVGYYGSVSTQYDAENTPLVIARESDNAAEDQLAKLRPLLGDQYRQVGTYALRPGVRLALFARRGLGE
jgi:uncharacterized protein (TIGR03663 family)